jgi:hypothetical protein
MTAHHHPNTSQVDREAVEDVGLADIDNRIGLGPDAVHVEEVLAT